MDASRFDRLTRALGASSRRGLSRMLGGLLLAAPLGFVLDFVDAEAKKKKRKKKKKCKGAKKKCGKKCILKTECCGDCGTQLCCSGTCANCCSDDDCPPGTGQICQNGICACPVGETTCDESCVDLETDFSNCGACDNECPSFGCVHGACTCQVADQCPAGCFCSARKQGGAACVDGTGGQACDEDDDCPLGSFCLNVNVCSIPCVA